MKEKYISFVKILLLALMAKNIEARKFRKFNFIESDAITDSDSELYCSGEVQYSGQYLARPDLLSNFIVACGGTPISGPCSFTNGSVTTDLLCVWTTGPDRVPANIIKDSYSEDRNKTQQDCVTQKIKTFCMRL